MEAALAMLPTDSDNSYKIIHVSKDEELSCAHIKKAKGWGIRESEIEISYTYANVETAVALLDEANYYFQTLLENKNSFSPQDKYYYLGKLMWCLALACPLKRGSAAVSEFIYHSLCCYIGLPLAILSPGQNVKEVSNLSWDIKALFCNSIEDYAGWFSDSFERCNESVIPVEVVGS